MYALRCGINRREGLTRHGVGIVLVLLACLHASADALAANGFTVTDRGLRYRDLQVGSGPSAMRGDTVAAHVVGWLDERGRKGPEFFDSRSHGRTVSWVVGTDRVMPAWNEGVIGMQIGGKRLLMVPPRLGYGNRGVQGVVPGNAPLMLQLELIDLRKAEP